MSTNPKQYNIFNSELIIYYRGNSAATEYNINGKVIPARAGFIKGSHQKDHSAAIKWCGGENNVFTVNVDNNITEAYLIPNEYDSRMGNKVFKMILVTPVGNYVVDYYATNFIEMLAYGLTVDASARFNKPIVYVTGNEWVPNDYPSFGNSSDKAPKKVCKRELVIGQVYSNKTGAKKRVYVGKDANGSHVFLESGYSPSICGSDEMSLYTNLKSVSNVVINGFNYETHIDQGDCEVTLKSANHSIDFRNPSSNFNGRYQVVRMFDDRWMCLRRVSYDTLPTMYTVDGKYFEKDELAHLCLLTDKDNTLSGTKVDGKLILNLENKHGKTNSQI